MGLRTTQTLSLIHICGTSSNVMTYLAKGDVALSVGMTGVSTILAPFLTPLLTYIFAGQTVDVNMMSMFLSIVKVVIIPIVLGCLINRFFSETVSYTHLGWCQAPAP